MGEEFHASKPIYLQIVDKISQQIVRNEIKPGDKLPSVREMAVQTGVNPNTIQRTYSELERMAIVETKRGQGTFVSEKSEIITELKSQMQTDIIADFVNNMRELGFTEEDMIAGLKRYMLEKGNRHD
ncbi:GntR family transcriptional regulator (plasmid) [Bacillus sp. 31A1R]|uniref:GntR family transcriptional regulator n=1 Tax=Robertmurraya mangrovi TaxID=3098077 RepID=A0ABU5IUR0_9BACI|nr:GntR family transcriptional regulator [Bacillus sp. 31A1R]MDZ5470864.1 GntR family transcriptional regulator [Bacillus sp. 31A1R]